MISEAVTTKISKSTFSHPCSKFLATAKVGLAHYDSFCGGGSHIWPPLFTSDDGSTSYLSCLFDCCSVACGCRDWCGRSNFCCKSRICVWSLVCWSCCLGFQQHAKCRPLSGIHVLRQCEVLPHWDRSCRSDLLSRPVIVRPLSQPVVALTRGLAGLVVWFVGCLTSQQHASVFQGQICSDNVTCCRRKCVNLY